MIKIKLQLEKANNMDSKQKIIYTKSCLEFLDYKCVTPDDKDFRIYKGKNSVIPSMVDANFNDGFLNDWNWIMEVVEAIKKHGSVKIETHDINTSLCVVETENYYQQLFDNTTKKVVIQSINEFLQKTNGKNRKIKKLVA